jgi:hypothetical protein
MCESWDIRGSQLSHFRTKVRKLRYSRISTFALSDKSAKVEIFEDFNFRTLIQKCESWDSQGSQLSHFKTTVRKLRYSRIPTFALSDKRAKGSYILGFQLSHFKSKVRRFHYSMISNFALSDKRLEAMSLWITRYTWSHCCLKPWSLEALKLWDFE